MSTSARAWLGDASLYVRKFAARGRTFASVAPSSRAMARVAAAHVDPGRPQNVLELGAGTGSLTGVILRRMHPGSRLLAVELEPDFAALLRDRHPRATVVTGCASTAGGHLRAAGMTPVDAVVSGLAFPSLPAAVCRAVLETYRDLATSAAWFSQLTVSPWVFLPLYKRLFHDVRFHPAVWNLPPGGIYHCRGLRADFVENLPNR